MHSKNLMPAEWEQHAATWLSWPKNKETFPANVLEKVEHIYVQMIDALHSKEKINVLVDDQATENKARKLLTEVGANKNIIFHKVKTVDVWIRDYGPIFVRNRNIKITKWTFNAWGGKYDDLKMDDSVIDKLAPTLDLEIIKPGIILEGGSIDVNGKGTLLTTEQCLLNKNRNPHLNRQQIEKYLQKYLGVSNVIWLKEGIAGDDTDGHIDDIARFVNPRTVLCALEENVSDQNYRILAANFKQLGMAKDQDGNPIQVKPLPMPRAVKAPYGRLPASYANFYIGNGAILLPIFRDKNDEKAVSILEDHFPGRRVVPIYCEPLVWGLGGIHCVTQQQPS